MPHDDERYGRRIGGWLPHLDRETERLPVPVIYPRPSAPVHDPLPRARLVLATCALVVVAGVTGAMVVLLPRHHEDPPPPIADRMIFPDFSTTPDPSVAVSIVPAASSVPAASPAEHATSVAATVTSPPTSRPATHHPSPSATTHTPAPAPAAPSLTAGATVGLEVDRLAGFRVRHRNFLGRADRISSSSSALDRADSRFVVRKGLGASGCVSFESVNYPGYFLRHRDFVIHLDRRDASRLFAQDATFCPVRTGDGAVLLRSINYPSYAVALHRDRSLHLDRGGATAFVVRSPL
jgi:hypothetical protein